VFRGWSIWSCATFHWPSFANAIGATERFDKNGSKSEKRRVAYLSTAAWGVSLMGEERRLVAVKNGQDNFFKKSRYLQGLCSQGRAQLSRALESATVNENQVASATFPNDLGFSPN
jgi:hypothetical protein